MSTAVATHWRLVAPWWRWDLRETPDPARARWAGSPALLKFASTDYVKDFLREPQRSVAWTNDDYHHTVEPIPAPSALPPGHPYANKKHRRLFTRQLVRSDTRKLFQPAHQRFYLVAFALHCDEPGFPFVDPAKVAEAGFVVRRRRASIPEGAVKDAAAMLAELTAKRAEEHIRRGLDLAKDRSRLLLPVRSPARNLVVEPGAATLAARREVVLTKRRLQVWAQTQGVTQTCEGWAPGDDGVVGSWVPVPDQPQELVERTYPMHRLMPAPDDPAHDALGTTLFFGAVPTASDEALSDASPRFDETSLYEIRCYVRLDAGDCPGPLVWSAPSEAFRLAAFMDPTGCAQRPVSIRLPDLAQLEAAMTVPSVRTSAPPGPQIQAPKNIALTGGKVVDSPIEEICFFSIPLITIIAWFVLNLFLPIVVYLFGLWWMLKLKFCIPPSLQVEAGLLAELDVIPGGLQAAAGLSVDVDLTAGVDAGDLRDAIEKALADRGLSQDMVDKLFAENANDPLVTLLATQGFQDDPDAPRGPQFPVSLPYAPRVERDQVVHP